MNKDSFTSWLRSKGGFQKKVFTEIIAIKEQLSSSDTRTTDIEERLDNLDAEIVDIKERLEALESA